MNRTGSFSRRAFLLAFLLLALSLPPAGIGVAAPSISFSGVVNAAGFMPPPRAGSAIAQGSVFSIFGAGLGPEPGVTAPEPPLLPSLGGVSVRVFTPAGDSVGALLLYAGATQINAIMPSGTAAGLNFVSVTYAGQTSSAVPIKVVHSSFGIFTRGLAPPAGSSWPGARLAAVQNVMGSGELQLNGPETPARRGQTVTLWGTGLGAAAGPDAIPSAARQSATLVEVDVGGQAARVSYSGRSPCCPGVDQINLRIPENSSLGCFVPVSVRVRGVVYSNVEAISISADGSPCQDARGQIAPDGGQRVGRISLSRMVNTGEANDMVEGIFLEAAGASPLAALPAPGTCLLLLGPRGSTVILLDAGPQLSISGPAGGVLAAQQGRVYRALAPPGPLFLGPGSYSVSGPGGADVGSFTASIEVPEPPRWDLGESSDRITRNRGFTVTWQEPAEPAQKAREISILLSAGSSEQVFCSAPAEASVLTVPPSILTNLPQSDRRPRGTEEFQFSSLWRPPDADFSAAGLDDGFVEYRHTESTIVSLSAPELPSSPVNLPNGAVIQAELATSFGERQRGLMNRTELAAGRGMLFEFEQAALHRFWMFGTLIPLDIIWLDPDRRVVFISADTPPCESSNPGECPTYGPQQPSRFVLELAGGQAATNGLRLGDQLEW